MNNSNWKWDGTKHQRRIGYRIKRNKKISDGLVTGTLNADNLEKTIDIMRKINPWGENIEGIILPKGEKILNPKRYSGKGRPKKEDYDWIDIDWFRDTPLGIKKI